MKIENWAVVTPNPNPYLPQEVQSASLQGKVFGHPRFDDGKKITTSSIVGKNKSGKVVTVSGSEYKLGNIDPSYESKFSNARSRFMNSLSIV